jgi:hypothetical protein
MNALAQYCRQSHHRPLRQSGRRKALGFNVADKIEAAALEQGVRPLVVFPALDALLATTTPGAWSPTMASTAIFMAECH